ncbi:hypothetical protein [Glutamicibacter halophytocola]|uniref:hypothetical protein n=1 Tax=Glutamicibacter halophytocola TaxID=1933880 RepID=UPI001892C3B2|nr:hypothetical protein [Glutamicibacter halophytocola]
MGVLHAKFKKRDWFNQTGSATGPIEPNTSWNEPSSRMNFFSKHNFVYIDQPVVGKERFLFGSPPQGTRGSAPSVKVMRRSFSFIGFSDHISSLYISAHSPIIELSDDSGIPTTPGGES